MAIEPRSCQRNEARFRLDDSIAWSEFLIFKETTLPGAYIIDLERFNDVRGYFARAWCNNELLQQGLKAEVAQSNVGSSRRKGTLRGRHLQRAPHAEAKIVRCIRGAIFGVITDLG